MPPLLWTVGCITGLTAVGTGAFGAHALKRYVRDPQKLASWGTAAHYQLIHAVPLLLASTCNNPVAGALFAAGITCFSGSIYLLTLWPDKFRFLGPVTPIGGLLLMAGWVALARKPPTGLFSKGI